MAIFSSAVLGILFIALLIIAVLFVILMFMLPFNVSAMRRNSDLQQKNINIINENLKLLCNLIKDNQKLLKNISTPPPAAAPLHSQTPPPKELTVIDCPTCSTAFEAQATDKRISCPTCGQHFETE